MESAWEMYCRLCFSSDHTFDFYTAHPNGLTHTVRARPCAVRLAFWCRISAPAQRSSEADPSLLIFCTKGQVEHRLSAVKSCCPHPHPPSVPVLTSADVDECLENRCHPSAICYNAPGSFSCRCPPGYHGDGLQCTPGKVWRSD